MTCPENGRDLFQANLDSPFYSKFGGLWTKEYFLASMKPVFAYKVQNGYEYLTTMWSTV